MANLRIETDLTPARADIDRLGKGLNQHAIQSIGSRGFASLAIWLRDETDEIRGGVQMLVNWNWLHICLIWIEEELRGQRLGEKLLSGAENLGRQRGCQHAHLDTFSFQARGFYERQGYEVYATLEDYPPGQSRYFMRRAL